MKRLTAIALLIVAVPVLLALGVGAKEDEGGSGYTVRAIFDNASYAVPGEEVRIAGVTAGKIESLEVTDDKKAAVTFSIDEPGFSPFHDDAHCTIRPQSLIGEKYVECEPGSAKSPEIKKIGDGEDGAGDYLLDLKHTSSPVDLDLVNDVMRLPYRQRFAIVINEFGTALAGRGRDLNEAIHRANPALRETDKVLAILADQNRTLANLVRDSDTVIAPLARNRKRVSHFIVAANQTGRATAERSADVMRTFERFPGFLRELRPTLEQLGRFSDEMTPVLADLDRAAPDLNRFILELGPFSRAATPAVVSLGAAAEKGTPALLRSLPLTRQLARFAKDAGPTGRFLDQLTRSIDRTGGIERIMDYIFFQVTAINGFDGISHYLRAGLITNLCSAYAVRPAGGCNANYTRTSSFQSAGAGGNSDPSLDKIRAELADPPKPAAGDAGDGEPSGSTEGDPFKTLRALTDPRIAAQRRQVLRNARGGRGDVSPAFGKQDANDRALDYLLGNDR